MQTTVDRDELLRHLSARNWTGLREAAEAWPVPELGGPPVTSIADISGGLIYCSVATWLLGASGPRPPGLSPREPGV